MTKRTGIYARHLTDGCSVVRGIISSFKVKHGFSSFKIAQSICKGIYKALSFVAVAVDAGGAVPAPRFFNRPLARPPADAEYGTVRRRSERRQQRTHMRGGGREGGRARGGRSFPPITMWESIARHEEMAALQNGGTIREIVANAEGMK